MMHARVLMRLKHDLTMAETSGCLWPSPSMPSAAANTRLLPMCRPSIWMISRSSLDRSDAIHSAIRSEDNATNRREAADFEVPSPTNDRQIALGKPYSPPELARRHVDQHQIYRPAAKPALGLRRGPARERKFVAVEAAHRGDRPWKPILPLVRPQR